MIGPELAEGECSIGFYETAIWKSLDFHVSFWDEPKKKRKM
jgi:hypothetical protein